MHVLFDQKRALTRHQSSKMRLSLLLSLSLLTSVQFSIIIFNFKKLFSIVNCKLGEDCNSTKSSRVEYKVVSPNRLHTAPQFESFVTSFMSLHNSLAHCSNFFRIIWIRSTSFRRMASIAFVSLYSFTVLQFIHESMGENRNVIPLSTTERAMNPNNTTSQNTKLRLHISRRVHVTCVHTMTWTKASIVQP